MSRVFFDTMVLVYGFEDHPEFASQVRDLLGRCHERGDTLLTSCLAIGEVMAGQRAQGSEADLLIREMGFEMVPFAEDCMRTFAKLRSAMKLKAPDAIHLACAAAAQTDLFLTNDKQLLQRRLHVPGIQFIAHFGSGVL